MRVIVITGKKGKEKTRLTVELADRTAIEKVKTLINIRKYAEAISTILAKGKFIRELTEKEMVQTSSELVLTDVNAYWNLL